MDVEPQRANALWRVAQERGGHIFASVDGEAAYVGGEGISVPRLQADNSARSDLRADQTCEGHPESAGGFGEVGAEVADGGCADGECQRQKCCDSGDAVTDVDPYSGCQVAEYNRGGRRLFRLNTR